MQEIVLVSEKIVRDLSESLGLAMMEKDMWQATYYWMRLELEQMLHKCKSLQHLPKWKAILLIAEQLRTILEKADELEATNGADSDYDCRVVCTVCEQPLTADEEYLGHCTRCPK
jgi:hypothetical protein